MYRSRAAALHIRAAVPDRGLAEVVGKLASATGTERDVAVPIAWSADGRLLATGLPQDGLDGRTGRLGITLLNTATGRKSSNSL